MKRITDTKLTYLYFILIFIFLYISNKYFNTSSIIYSSSSKEDIIIINQDPLDDYIKIHESIISGLHSSNEKKIVFFRRNDVGFANRVYGFLTSLTIAILTDSAFLTDWPNIQKFIQPPLRDVFKKFPINSDLNSNYMNQTNYTLLPLFSKNSWKYEKCLSTLLTNTIPSGQNRLYFQSYTAYFFDIVSHPIYYNKLLHYNLVKNDTIKHVNELFNYDRLNEINEDVKIENLLKIGFEVGSNLMNKFWTPTNNLTNRINKFIQNEFKSYFIIGIQLRLDYIDWSKDLDKFLKCALYLEENFSSLKETKWFVTSDSEWIIDELKRNYTNKILHGYGQIGHVNEDVSSYFRAVFDNELLSKSNEIIITGGSTYGFIAAMKNGRLPFYIEGKRVQELIQNEPIEPCKRMTLNHSPRTPTGDALF